MPKIVKPGSLLKNGKPIKKYFDEIEAFQKANEPLQVDGKFGRQMWAYVTTSISGLKSQNTRQKNIIAGLNEHIVQLDRENSGLLKDLVRANLNRFSWGIVGVMIGFGIASLAFAPWAEMFGG